MRAGASHAPACGRTQRSISNGTAHHELAEVTQNTWFDPHTAGAGKLTMSGYPLVLSLSKDVFIGSS